MQPDDPLDQLLASWNPRNPAAKAVEEDRFVADTMRAVRVAPPKTMWRRGMEWLDQIVQEWLPAPGALLPAMGAIVLLLGVAHVTVATSHASVASVIEWRDSVMKPTSPLWISAAYRDIANTSAPAQP
jgi:hypothetical protein